MKTFWRSTTEDGEWILLPFRTRSSNLSFREARREAARWRLRGHLARVLRTGKHDQGRCLVVTHKPRVIAPRPIDLTV